MSYSYCPRQSWQAKPTYKTLTAKCITLAQLIAKIIESDYEIMKHPQHSADKTHAAWGVGTAHNIVTKKDAQLCTKLYAKYGKLDVTMTEEWLTKDMTL